MALLGNLTAGQEGIYADIFDELDPESLVAPSLTQFVTAREFGQQMFGCDQVSTARTALASGARSERTVSSATAIAAT